MAYRFNPGLGTMLKQDSAGNVIDCDTWAGVLESVCWNPLSPIVTEPNLPNPPAPVPPSAPTGSALTVAPASGEQAQATVDALVAAAGQQSQTATQQFFNQLSADVGTPGCVVTIFPNTGICDYVVYWGLGIGAAVYVLKLLGAVGKARGR